jgi:hypothetical protein
MTYRLDGTTTTPDGRTRTLHLWCESQDEALAAVLDLLDWDCLIIRPHPTAPRLSPTRRVLAVGATRSNDAPSPLA